MHLRNLQWQGIKPLPLRVRVFTAASSERTGPKDLQAVSSISNIFQGEPLTAQWR